jgi:hypothetical protein
MRVNLSHDSQKIRISGEGKASVNVLKWRKVWNVQGILRISVWLN